jgi:LacI family transcriptional regulator
MVSHAHNVSSKPEEVALTEVTSRPITMTQVAQYAGVSQASVSRVLNGVATVDPAIVAKVNRAVAALNYSPSEAARSLVRGRSQTIALLVPDLENPMFQGILKGLTVAAARDGYRVLVADSAEAVGIEAEIASEARSKCDALVLVSPRMPDADLRELIQRTTPVVVVNRRVDDSAAAQLSVDYATAVKELGVHLMGFGHRRIAYVAGPPLSWANDLRAQGLGELVRDNPGLEILTVPAGSSMEAGYDAADAVLETGATAAIAFNDLVALGLLSRLREVGVDVPDQLSIVGIDDIPQSRFAVPPLTTMSVPRIEIGRQAWNRMRQALEGETADHPLFYRPVLVARRSSGPASHASGWVGPARPVLRLGSTVVAQYEEGSTVDSVLSPRPFLDNVVSRAGTPLTVTEPTDHPHHLGVSLAIPDVNGTSYWGGRTYVRGEGSIMVPNHGRQRRDRLSIDGHSLHERLSWVDHTGTTQLVEVRELRSAELANGWALRWRSHLKATLDAITFASPATNGREGAGYGGVFWRFAPEIARVFSPAGDTEREVHGASTPWIAFTFPERGTTVILTQGESLLPWFVRFAEYLGAGPAIAWDESLTIPEGGELDLELTAYVLDEELADAAAVERALPGLRAEADL